MTEQKTRIILSGDEWAALTAINNAETFGQRTSKEARLSARLVELGLVGKNADGCLAITPWGKQIIRKRPEQVDGAYTRKKGLRRTYEYSAIWDQGEQGSWWAALVRYDNQIKGNLSASQNWSLTPNAETAVAMAETSIESLIGMQE